MNLTAQQIWLVAFGTVYVAATSFWARQSALRDRTPGDFFTAGGGLPSWFTALALSGVSLSAWMMLGLPAMISRAGFPAGALALSTVLMAIVGVLVFKRQWQVGKRFGARSQGQLFAFYYRSRGLSLLSSAIATLFAVAFCGMQLNILGRLMAELSGGGIATEPATWLLALMLFSYVIVGGMFAVGALGALQTFLLALGILGMSIAAVFLGGGFAAINAALAKIAQAPSHVALFRVEGVVRFLPAADAANGWTAGLILTMGLSFAGIQASPLAAQLVLSTRDDRGFAAGQTWVLASFFGAVCVFGLTLVGAYGLILDSPSPVATLLGALGARSPWFMAALYMSLVAAYQVVAAVSLVSASHALVRDVYAPFFELDLGDVGAVLYGRIAIGLLLLASVLLVTRAPTAMVELGAIALPASAQLIPALIGLCWRRGITAQAALVGAVVGIVSVVLTEDLGAALLSFLGLHLPWGRWPWTLASAGWGLAANVATVLVISAITPARQALHRADLVHGFLDAHATMRPSSRALKPTVWAAALAWIFLGVGPGLVFGNFALGDSTGGFDKWIVGMPPLWAWCLSMWAPGVFLVWLLSYKLELASPSAVAIRAVEEGPKARARDTRLRTDRLQVLLWTVSGVGGFIAIFAWVFGN